MATGKDPLRVLTGRIGAYTLHSRYDSRELLEPARRGFEAKFEREVDPDMVLDPEERARRAEMARKAYFSRLALKSAQARRKRGRPRSGHENPVGRTSYPGWRPGGLTYGAWRACVDGPIDRARRATHQGPCRPLDT